MPDSLQSHGPQPTRFLCPWDPPGKSTGVGRRALPQGIFPTQRPNWHLLGPLPWQVGSLPLAPPGKPLQIKILKFISFLKDSLWRTPRYDTTFIPNIPQSLVYLSHGNVCVLSVQGLLITNAFCKGYQQAMISWWGFTGTTCGGFCQASALDVRDDWETHPSSLQDVLFTVKYLNRWESAVFQGHALLHPDTHTHTHTHTHMPYYTWPAQLSIAAWSHCVTTQSLLLTLMFGALVVLWKSWVNLSKS